MLPGERSSWPKRRWVACVGGKGATHKTLTEAKRWVERKVSLRFGHKIWLNSVIVQSGTGSTYQGRTTSVVQIQRGKSVKVFWTKL